MTGINSITRKCLITGFGPFPGVKINPSELLVKELNRLQPEEFQNFEWQTEILPTQWEASLRCLDLLNDEFNPTVMIHFGVSSKAVGLQLEHRAHNKFSTKPDAAGCRFSEGNKQLLSRSMVSTKADIETLIDILKDTGIPVYSSNDTGDYICNGLYYHSLELSRKRGGPELTLFVHIPPIADSIIQTGSQQNNTSTLDTLTKGAIKIVAAIMEKFKTENTTTLS